MRTRIIFGLNNKGAILPFHHQQLISKLLEGLLLNSGKCTNIRESMLSISFSGIKGQTKVGKSGLHYCSNKLTLVISGIDKNVLTIIVNELFKYKKIMIGKLEVVPEDVSIEDIGLLSVDTKYLCISPIILSKSEIYNTQNIDLFSDLLSDLLYDSVMQKIESLKLFEHEDLNEFSNFQVVVDKEYISKATKSNKKFSRTYKVQDTSGEKREYIGYTFPFTLYAHPKIQELVVSCGIGEFTEKGFGMLDIVEKQSKLIPFEVRQERRVIAV